uniref:SH2 domain-containing protein n=1 Tax=Plectus sambesii TaxID=2011161 RepID=A0A914XPE5_9BILA
MNNGASAASTAAYFDPFDMNSYYFPSVSRDEATTMLSGPDVAVGTFLLRDSGTSIFDHSLSV